MAAIIVSIKTEKSMINGKKQTYIKLFWAVPLLISFNDDIGDPPISSYTEIDEVKLRNTFRFTCSASRISMNKAEENTVVDQLSEQSLMNMMKR
jgi:hypothetical protein